MGMIQDYIENGYRSAREYLELLGRYEKDEDVIGLLANTYQAVNMYGTVQTVPPFNVMLAFEIAKHIIPILKSEGYTIEVTDIPSYDDIRMGDLFISSNNTLDMLDQLVEDVKTHAMETIVTDTITSLTSHYKSRMRGKNKKKKIVLFAVTPSTYQDEMMNIIGVSLRQVIA